MTRGMYLEDRPVDEGPRPHDPHFAQFNAEPPAAVETCVHQLIDRHCDNHAEAPAVCAWDGDFTYKDLRRFARSLGKSLSAKGVGPDVFVPIYFEKSRWTIVAMLGVLHAGGAFVLLDPSHPIQRLEYICQTVKAPLVVASSQNATQASRLAPDVVVLGEKAELECDGPEDGSRAGRAMPNNAAYSIFTSGTTGNPKGVVIEHRSLSTSCVAHGSKMKLTRSSRVLQFSAYAWDICLMEMLTVLVHGGCVCVPSEAERRRDLAAAVGRFRVNWAILTPSVARSLDPTAMPTLKNLACAGEAMTKADLEQWVPHVNLINVYGPAECTIAACITEPRGVTDIPANVGHPVGGRCWIVDENDVEIVRPVGQPGEIVIEGPIVGRGYIAVKSSAAAGFVDRPRWLKALWPYTTGPVYRTGDLGRRHEDGSIECLGRKDAQLKVHGQRMEAAEVEYHLRQHLPARDLAVDLVQPKDDSESPLLAAFVVLDIEEATTARVANSEPHLTASNDDFRFLVEGAKTKLRQVLPSYMIPSAFLTLSCMPLSTTGKLDRRHLRQMGGSRTRRELQQSGQGTTVRISPRNATEETLRRLWSEVLHLPSLEIGVGDSFWKLGGSSIRAMKLAGLARQEGYVLEAQDIWAPVKRFGAYTITKEFTLPVNVDIRQFRRAWDSTIQANPILRTRIIADNDGGLWQAVIRDNVSWDTRNPADDIPWEWKDWKLGQRLVRLALSRPSFPDAAHVFTLVIHHAILDGWSLPLILEQVNAAYNGQILDQRPFRPFMQYLLSQDQDEIDRHWRRRLADLSAAVFPKLPSPDYVPVPRVSTAHTIPISSTPGAGQTTVPNQITLAWGLLISYYTDNWDVLFGLTVAGRGAPVQGIDTMTGPTIASIPVRLLLDPQATVADTLRRVQTASVESIPFEQAGLQRISRLGGEHAMATQFQSHLVIQPDEREYPRPLLFPKSQDLTNQADVSSYGISMIVEPSATSIELHIAFDPVVVGEVQMQRMMHQFDHIFQQLRQAPEARLRDIQGLSPLDFAELRRWNSHVPPSVEQCAHDQIYQRTLIQPNAPAVCAWDGEFTYYELDLHAGRLARRLAALGVGPETFVPLYFEKSRWTSVAMLGVLKAGGAFGFLDLSYPTDRLRQICREMHASVVICSEANAPSVGELGPSQVVIVGSNETEWMGNETTQELIPATPDNAMYVVFTSGSTGKPKGIVMTHAACCTAAKAFSARYHLTQGSRVLQFSAYAFDVSITDHIVTLVAGGCVCIPSEEDRRSNLAGIIATLRADWAMITPSTARILSPQTAPGLKNLVLVGEPMNTSDIQQWSSHLHLMNGYGPAESAVLVTLQPHVRDITPPTDIGIPYGSAAWVVDPLDPTRLSPLGAVGELLVEGPTLARGYLNEPQKTAEAFLESLPWLCAVRNAPCRVYKTGDLVQYTSEGALMFVGRKDTQIKLRGQRVEIGEVEHHLQRCFPDASAVAADLITPPDGRAALLAGFVCCTPVECNASLFQESDVTFRKAAALALSQLGGVLPPYMVPAVLIPVNRLPFSATGKLDRRQLREQSSLLSPEQLDRFRVAETGPVREPETQTQRALQQLFTEVLSLPQREIGIDDHFLRRGGDSLSAMKLVALARNAGYSFTVADVFASPRIVDLADKIGRENGTPVEETPPFSLSPGPEAQHKLIAALMDQTDLGEDQIEDLYPCTPMQEGLMALSLKEPGQYLARFVYDLSEGVDLDCFRTAFDKTVAANPILRTRLVQGTTETFQVVVRDLPPWDMYRTQEEHDIQSRVPVMAPNLCLLQPTLIASPPRFVLTIHHALYDGPSLDLLWKQIEAAYRGQQLQSRPFSPFIRYLQQDKGSTAFWKAQFEGVNAAVFPALPSPAHNPKAKQAVCRRVALESVMQKDFTLTTAIQLAWALLLSHYTDSSDVVYGLVLSGRSAPIPGIEDFTGPTMTTVPFHVRLNPKESIQKALDRIQEQRVAMIAHEQTGLRKIRGISEDSARACEFQNQLIIQPPTGTETSGIATEASSNGSDYSGFASYGLVLVCNLAAERHQSMEITAQYDPSMLDPEQAERMVVQLEHVLGQILSQPQMSVCDISAVSPADWKQLARWNAILPSSREMCLHDLVLGRCALQPDAPAVSAWDGDLTFQQLASLSSHLARFFREQGVQEGTVVPVCLERSRCCILTMMAVLCTGAALVCIDYKFPRKRVQQIVDQVNPQVVIASKETREKFEGCSATILTAPFTDEPSAPEARSHLEVAVDPGSPAFILFTSGSTGRPKGIVMEHRHISTGIRDHSGPMRVTPDSRVLHFASYAFDAYIWEIFTTIVIGGCVCVPSETDRTSALQKFIAEKQVNLALLTPSVLAMLDPDQFPSLKSVIAGGEPMTRHVARRWAPRVVLVDAYGPAEICISCAAGQVVDSDDRKPGTIGPIHGGCGWVTVPSDPGRLAPLGAVGELVLEGPSVTRGYLNNPELTRAAFIEAPGWLSRWRHGKPGRLYRTGDLVQLTSEGSIRVIGRKDNQVKLRGQRIELTEVEHHVRRCVGDADAVVDVATVNGSSILVACILVQQDAEQSTGEAQGFFCPPTDRFHEAVQVVESRLREFIPTYMVPSIFLPVAQVPQTASGKTDRRRLRQAIEALSPSDMQGYASASRRTQRQPSTWEEATIQSVWARALKKTPDMVGLDDSFFHLGGDSISAMQVVSELHRVGIRTTVGAIFQQKTIAGLAKTVSDSSVTPKSTGYQPFSLSPIPYSDMDAFLKATLPQLGLSCTAVDDIYPCSPVQQGMLMSQYRAGDVYNNRFLFTANAPPGSARVAVDRLAAAWHRVVQRHPMLRSCILGGSSLSGGLDFQLVHRTIAADLVTTILPASQDPLQALQRTQRMVPMLGRPPHHLTLCSSTGGEVNGMLEISHVLMDGTSFQILLRDLIRAYDDRLPSGPGPAYSAYIAHLESLDRTATQAYWAEYLRESPACLFPASKVLSESSAGPRCLRTMEFDLKNHAELLQLCAEYDTTFATLMHIAWGLVLRVYTGSDDVCFGYAHAGRDVAEVPGVLDAVGPFINVLVCRMHLSRDGELRSLVRQVQQDILQSAQHQHIALADIQRSANLPNMSLFNSVVSFDKPAPAAMQEGSILLEPVSGEGATEYDLSVAVTAEEHRVHIILEYWSTFLSDEQAAMVADTFEQAVYQLTSKIHHETVGQLDLLGAAGRSQIAAWNSHLPPHLDCCAHELISQRCVERPSAPAVCAHDGDLTYGDLETLASEMASHLAREYGIGPGFFVPVCFEKSRWVVVAVLAILKTGAAFVLLDPAHPPQRLQEICHRVQAPLVITSETQRVRAEGLASRLVVIGEHSSHWREVGGISAPCRSVRPESPAYVVFTSGSTGKPKGVVISHAGLCTNAMANNPKFGLQPSSRVLQFSSYAFDASVQDLLFTLLGGACICIMSDEERVANLAGAINRLQANFACLTPSVARILDPSEVPSLQILSLVGETVAPGDVAKWKPFVSLRNGYGPAECTIVTALRTHVDDEHDAANVGHAYGSVIWITAADDPERLAPVGSIGELIIEGTTVSPGYLNDEQKTKAAFLSPPAWLGRLRGNERPRRLYRTGDLVQYEPTDGSIRYIGRKDTQVKLRGQRIELGEIEFHLRRCFPGPDIEAVAEVVLPAGEGRSATLMAFIADHRCPPGPDSLVGTPDGSFRQAINVAVAELDQVLPIFMVPQVFIPVRDIPLNSGGKVNRRALRDAAAALPDAFFDTCAATVTDGTVQPPTTAAERVFQRLFADLFGRADVMTIGNTDHFFRLGGDSIRAMTLIPKAREEGYAITMSDVFTHPRLCDLAHVARRIEDDLQCPVLPFALIPASNDLVSIAAMRCRVPVAQIQDIYPCTPLQEGLMALSIKSANRYVVTFRYELDPRVDLDHFQTAWIDTMEANPILRTRMIQSDCTPGTFQVVLADCPHFLHFADLDKHDRYTQAQPRGLGDELVQLALIHMANGAVQFHLTLHHALYDGWTIPALWHQVSARYRDPSQLLSLRPFNRFIHYVQQQQEKAAEYWRAEFSGLDAPVWPALPSTRCAPGSHSSINRTITGISGLGGSEYTPTTFIHLAWALLMSCHTDSDDLVFGVTLNGRSASLLGIEEMTGPTITTFPLRVRLGLDCDTVEGALASIQRQAAARMPFQQFGLQNIRRVSGEADQACQFQCHLGIQHWSSDSQASTDLFTPIEVGQDDLAAFAEYALLVICHLNPTDSSTVTVEVNYDEQAVSPVMARRILGQFSHMLQQLPLHLQTPLDRLELVGDEDRHQLLEWNRSVPPSFNVCLHDLVLRHVLTTPKATAVSAWDGELTFGQLNEVSWELASHLRPLGVRPGALVPLCFEKSKWAVITILAVLRAGGACVLLDPGHPAQHIETIISRTKARLVLTSLKTRPRVQGHGEAQVMTIPLQNSAAPAADSSWPAPSCHDTAFVVFTSGSTGQPKGILMEHSHLCTSIRDHSPPMRINSSSRALHFASYAFDASIYELFSVLVNGGCVCIPSDTDRLSNLAGFIRAASINYAIFTPSILNRMMRPEEVPTLRTVTLGGEAVTQDVVDTWANRLTLINGYGPAEATICAAGLIDPSKWTAGTIGPVVGGVGWVTLPSDVSRLAPLGAVGELLIEGPVVTRGYLHDADRTAAAYIPPPAWLSNLRGSGNEGRLYRTGDLVQYTDDGGIRYVGRKDTQIKLRGQRIELSHVEHHVRLCFVDAAEVVAEIVMRDGVPTLMAFIADQAIHGKRDAGQGLLSAPSAAFRAQVHSATARLKASLPAYMVPMAFFPLAWVPRTSSDKLDRRRLRDYAADLSVDQIRACSMHSGEASGISAPPRTSREHLLQELWAVVLSTPRDQIGVDDDFFQLGGDSIQAMKLTSMLRQRGLTLQVSDIFAEPTLAEQARRATKYVGQEGLDPYRPGSLLGIADLESFTLCQLQSLASQASYSSSPSIRPSDVDDIFPVTEFQRQFLGTQVNYVQLTLPPNIDVDRLTQACQAMLRRHPILQSVFLPYEHNYIQVMLRHLDFQLFRVHCDGEMEPFIDRLCTEDATDGVPWGTPYFRATLVSRSSHESVLLLRISHAQYDGQSFPFIVQDLTSAYEGVANKTPPPPPFQLYLRYRQSQANADTYQFWEQYLHKARMISLRMPAPTILPADGSACGDIIRTRHIPLPTPPRGVTVSSLIKAAWAVVLAQVTGVEDLVFGHVLNGRDVPLEGAHAISGPCVTISPIRIILPPSRHVPDLLRHVQDQYMRAMPYANLDFETIRRHATPWPKTTFFDSIVTHQNGGDIPTSYTFQSQQYAFKIRLVATRPGGCSL
nr:non ribosomal peptide synthetase [Aspergillus sp.]